MISSNGYYGKPKSNTGRCVLFSILICFSIWIGSVMDTIPYLFDEYDTLEECELNTPRNYECVPYWKSKEITYDRVSRKIV